MVLLSLPSTYVVILSFSTSLIYLFIGYVLSYRRLCEYKGPLLASLSQYWLFRVTLKSQVSSAGADVLRKYGSPARIGPNLLLTDDPALMRAINAPRSTFTRGSWYDGVRLDPKQDNVFSTRSDEVHNDFRTKMIHGYTGKELPHLESNIDDRVHDLITLIRKLSAGNQPFDMALIAQFFTMDAITHVALGKPFGYLERNEDMYDFLATTRSVMPILELGANHSWIKGIIETKLMQSLVAPSAKDSKGVGAVMGLARKVIDDRFKPNAEEHNDMIGSFKRHGLSQALTESESVLQITVGADSTATAIRMTLLYILTNPSVYAKLRQEIDDQTLDRKGVISCAEAKKMPYLQACIREGLRMFPPMQGLQHKLAPPEGVMVNGFFIPGNVQVGTNYHMMMRRAEIFGQDAEVFRPERWTEANGEEYNRMFRTQELVFGTSRFTCLGKNLAMMELDKVFVELLRNFDWAVVNPLNAMKTCCNGFHVQTGMMLTARARSDDEMPSSPSSIARPKQSSQPPLSVEA